MTVSLSETAAADGGQASTQVGVAWRLAAMRAVRQRRAQHALRACAHTPTCKASQLAT